MVKFEERPIAAASIGQVHRGVIRDADGKEVDVVLKIQYPGVARSFKSDLNNLTIFVTMGSFVPDIFFLNEALAHAEEKLRRECDYAIEASNQDWYRELVLASVGLRGRFYVRRVYPCEGYDLHSTRNVLLSEYTSGIPVDRIADQPQRLRNEVASTFCDLPSRSCSCSRPSRAISESISSQD